MRQTRSSAEGRLLLLRFLILVVGVVLTGRLWQLQMVQGESFRIRADSNRFRQVDVAAPRGVIYDRNGQILARNRPSFTIAVIPADLPKDVRGEPDEAADAAVLDRLFALLNRPAPAATTVSSKPTPQPALTPTPTRSALSPIARPVVPGAVTPPPTPIPDRQPYIWPRPQVEQAIRDGRLGGAYKSVTVASYIRETSAFLIAEDAANLPGVELRLDPIRDYPSGALSSLLIGYMGHIPETQLDTYEAQGYRVDEQVGLTALEAAFEDDLHGHPGRQTIEVDVNGRKVRTIGEPDVAVPGHNLVLSLDLELQRVATAALQEVLDQSSGFTKATQGVVVALDPRNGAVLAMVSLPSHDNNLFTKGITPEGWAALVHDPDLPMFNEAIGGQYPPGSTFKIFVASAGLQEGVITPSTRLGDGFDGSNDGVIWLPNEYLPWDRTRDQPFYSWIHKYGTGHGFVTLRDAIAVSDDIYFYQLGGGYLNLFRGLGVEAIGYYARQFGFGQETGIELGGEEARGLIPDTKWKRLNYAQTWLTGDTYNMSIGQGYVLATPLQVANGTAAIANRGYLYRPQLVNRITDADGKVVRPFTPDLIREIPVDPANLDTVREGMYGTINWPNGTAPGARLAGIAVAGKTGTAEFFRDWNKDGKEDRDEKGNLPTHAWFTAFAPYVDPEIVVTVFIANGGEGSAVAVPVAAKVLKAYFGVDQ